MTNNALIAAFVSGASNGKSNSMRIDAMTTSVGDVTVLVSYQTPIAIRQLDGTITATAQRYSVTTSRQQNMLMNVMAANWMTAVGVAQDGWHVYKRMNADAIDAVIQSVA